MAFSGHEVAQLLQAWSDNDRSALERLIPVVYPELHRLASLFTSREQTGHLLQAIALLMIRCHWIR
jgi:hypothetical protein